jgi:hypothetical protein
MNPISQYTITNEEIIKFFKENDFINIENFILKSINNFKNNLNNAGNSQINNYIIDNKLLTNVKKEYIQYNNMVYSIQKNIDKINKELIEFDLNNVKQLLDDNLLFENSTIKESDNDNNSLQYCEFCCKNIICKKEKSLRTHQNIHCPNKPKTKINDNIDDLSTTETFDEIVDETVDESINKKTDEKTQNKQPPVKQLTIEQPMVEQMNKKTNEKIQNKQPPVKQLTTEQPMVEQMNKKTDEKIQNKQLMVEQMNKKTDEKIQNKQPMVEQMNKKTDEKIQNKQPMVEQINYSQNNRQIKISNNIPSNNIPSNNIPSNNIPSNNIP